MNKYSASIGVWCLVALALVLVAEVQDAAAVNCSMLELSSCLGAVTGGGQPSPQCCRKLKEQKPCICGYLRNPSLRPYVNSPNARKVAAACGETIPQC
ncbi:hypothetical protein RD792_016906 [Penstemon davidsonii]|uniref:Bifunctional inhibitor/plant lipid transfer protein/seed storage helical domain-containing protein n=1 Tax=Penstemon davidsonii TaxID=160366 RepID=A0ABR0CKL1_9LAMI|nr:hypothetical protein RD792_016906 [Penstemon davidsonii]